jgi:hypothetical protein
LALLQDIPPVCKIIQDHCNLRGLDLAFAAILDYLALVSQEL